jgi:DNA-binding transcriptional MerR regulator
MATQADKRYRISEVSEMLQVAPHVLRQWEDRFTQFRPRRDRANRRYYVAGDIEIARRIKQLVRHEKMTLKGAARVLSQELRGEGRPKTRQEAIDLVDRLERDVRALLDRMDETDEKIRNSKKPS